MLPLLLDPAYRAEALPTGLAAVRTQPFRAAHLLTITVARRASTGYVSPVGQASQSVQGLLKGDPERHNRLWKPPPLTRSETKRLAFKKHIDPDQRPRSDLLPY